MNINSVYISAIPVYGVIHFINTVGIMVGLIGQQQKQFWGASELDYF